MKLRVEISLVVKKFSACPILNAARLDTTVNDSAACNHVREVFRNCIKTAKEHIKNSDDEGIISELRYVISVAEAAMQEVYELKFQRNVTVLRIHMPVGANRKTNENMARKIMLMLAYTEVDTRLGREFTTQIKNAIEEPDADTNYTYSTSEFSL